MALITNITEWFDPKQLPGGVFGPFYWDSEIRIRYLQRKIGWVIAISSLLENYYKAHGCNVIRIPPTINSDEFVPIASETNFSDKPKLYLAYAGVPGKKDNIDSVLRAIKVLRNEGMEISINLIGPTREYVSEICLDGNGSLLDELGEAVEYSGRVSHQAAKELVSKADFSILLRSNKRYANAGFSTKLVESLALGVPAIANPTSDIAKYVVDGKEGILIDDCSTQSFLTGVRRLLKMPREQWATMRVNARQQAVNSFDYRRYSSPLKEFLEKAVSSSEKNRK